LLGDGRVAFLGGGVDEYLERSRARRASLSAAAAQAAGTASARPVSSAAAERLAKKELAKLERQIEKLSEREAALHAELAASSTDYVKLTELGEQLRSVHAEKAGLEERWLQVATDMG